MTPGLTKSEPALDSSKVNFIVRSDINEPPIFIGHEGDKYTVQEWIYVIELYLQKSSCREVEKADTLLSHLLGRAKIIIKVGLKITASIRLARIYDMLRHYSRDHPVSL